MNQTKARLSDGVSIGPPILCGTVGAALCPAGTMGRSFAGLHVRPRGQPIRPASDRAGAQKDDHVAGPRPFTHQTCKASSPSTARTSRWPWRIPGDQVDPTAPSMGPRRPRKPRRSPRRRRRWSSWRRNRRTVAQAGVMVRLMNRDDAALGRLTRGFQHRRDLYRVMAVIVDDRDAVDLGHIGETPVDAAERRQCGADLCRLIPRSSATAIAASAFGTLWSPGIGRLQPVDRRSPSPCRITSKYAIRRRSAGSRREHPLAHSTHT